MLWIFGLNKLEGGIIRVERVEYLVFVEWGVNKK